MGKKLNPVPVSYWEIQKKQKRISVALFLLLFIFYLATIGLISGAVLFSLGFFLPGFSFFASSFFLKYAASVLVISTILTLVNFIQARKGGVQYILNNLRAYPPDPEDRYHLTFLNVVEEMRISSGLPQIKAFILPTINLNSLSLIDKDGSPAIVVTEGLLAESSRDELQAVVAHETAHILKTDTFLLTLICSIAAFYQKLVESVENQKEWSQADALQPVSRKQTGQPLIYLSGLLSYLLINFFIALISQKRELLADATAVELCRDPMALARIIYKAHISNSYLGDSTLFTPLFLVPPDSRQIQETSRDKLFNTHPPVMTRLRILTEMAHKTVKEVIEEVRLKEKLREKSRSQQETYEELPSDRLEQIKKLQEKSSQILEKENVWLIKNSKGTWEGPYSLGSLVALSWFTPSVRIKNLRENLEGRARDFAQVRFALYRQLKNQPINPDLFNRCPSCQTELSQSYYEGVKVKKCQACQGVLVRMTDLEKIFARKEIGFSEKLKQKAMEWSKAWVEPGSKPPFFSDKKPALCPECGLQFTVRPFNYYYLLPVYKCFHCQLIWFEPEELEILQILIEEKERNRGPAET
ncbi:MAG: zinc metalloprotease HtpX [Candidatus Saccharicenans sp.]